MTIAIGYLCYNGVIVAADTAVVAGPADLQEGSKLTTFVCNYGSFAMVHSCNDANSTATLIAQITRAIRAANPKTYLEVEGIFKREMTTWRRAFGGRKPPETQLILGAKLLTQQPKLFFCEPPNTVIEKDDYVAAGWGSAVTDPLYATLFANDGGAYSNVQQILRRVAYLLYRAKKDNVYCGKKSECAVVWRNDKYPSEIEEADLQRAEDSCAQLDSLFSIIAMVAFGSETTKPDSEELVQMVSQSSALLRGIVFRDKYGDDIKI